MKHPVSNTTAMTIYVGSSAVLPGETRHFELEDIPLHLRPPVEEEVPVEESADDVLTAVLAMNVKDASAKLKDLTTEQLEKLGELEQKRDGPRRTLLSAIAEESLNRAAGQDRKDLIDSLPGLDDAQFKALTEKLQAEGKEVAEDVAAAIAVETARREAAAGTPD